ncbi:MAG: M14 family zinc carboxypeptidase [Actinomycetota bacterium]
MRRALAVGLAGSLFAVVALVVGPAERAISSPVATSEAEYQVYGRIFPDPHGCNPAGSPFAKGNVCATDFMQFRELQLGVELLEEFFPKYVEWYTLHEDFDCTGKPAPGDNDGCDAFRSAGLPVTASADGQDSGVVTRDRQPLHMLRVTDESVPDKGKDYFVFPLSIHGIERAGVEGGTRAAEDLATWAACESGNAPDIVDCDAEGPIPHPLLEATPDKSVTAGHALKNSVIYFIYPNPDGWVRGERTSGTQFFQRYNGNGVDLNRDWPEQGYTFRPYTPWSEPESRGYGKVLQAIGPKDSKGNPKWTGGIDLHGQLIDRAFSFTLIGGSQRPYDMNQRVLQTVKGAWADAEKRLAWSPLIKPNDAPDDDPRVYGVQWGTIWDTIDYTVTGALGNWIDSPIGLNGDGIDNEMSMSHLSNCGIGSCWIPDVEQLHVDGNKSLIYSMINYSLKPENTDFDVKGNVGYVHNPGVIKRATNRNSPPPKFTKLPTQDDITGGTLDPSNDYIQEFRVKGPKQGVYNGGIEVTITCANAQGVGPCALDQALLERARSPEPNAQGEDWEVVNSYYNQSSIYVQAGQALHANFPAPGRYRVRLDGESTSGVFTTKVDFTKEKGWEDPGQIGYEVSNMDFWQMMKEFVKPGLTKLTIADITGSSSWKSLDTIVLTDAVHREIAGELKQWVAGGGNLVLTDKALGMLEVMNIVDAEVKADKHYAGYINFATSDRESTYKDPLAEKINQPGAAEGQNGDEVRRRQTYEPVPLGMAIQNANGGDADNAPVWWVPQSALNKAAGKARAVGTTGDFSKVSLGEISYKAGKIRFAGALLPMPVDNFDHPFGLASYALTYSGYQILQNMLTYQR